MTLWYLCCLQWLQLSLQLELVYLYNGTTTIRLLGLKSHVNSFFTSNKNLHIWVSRAQCGSSSHTTWGSYFSSNYHSDVVVCSTPETSLNDLSLWCIGGAVGCYCRSMTTSSELHPHRCHTLRWYCCVPGHSNTRGWATHTLSTHINSVEVKLSDCMYKSTREAKQNVSGKYRYSALVSRVRVWLRETNSACMYRYIASYLVATWSEGAILPYNWHEAAEYQHDERRQSTSHVMISHQGRKWVWLARLGPERE